MKIGDDMKKSAFWPVIIITLFALVLFWGCGDNGSNPPNNDDVTDIAISTRWTAMTDSETRTISAKAYDSDGVEVEADIQWSSSAPSVATVDGGTICGVGAGIALITAEAGGATSEPCTVHVADQWILYSGNDGLRIITPDNETDLAIPGTHAAKGPVLWQGQGIMFAAAAPYTFSYLYFRPFDAESSIFVFDGYIEPIYDIRPSATGGYLITKYLAYSIFSLPSATGLSASIDDYVDLTVPDVDLREFDPSPSGDSYIVDATLPSGPRMIFLSSDGTPSDTLLHTNGKCPRFSPDGSSIAYGNTGRLWLADVATLTRSELLSEGSSIDGLCWAPDGDAIAMCVRNALGNYELWICDPSTGTKEKLTNAQTAEEYYLPQWLD